MTYKELYLKEHPDVDSDELQEIIDAFCPGDVWEGKPDADERCELKCFDCWNSEIPEEKTEGFKAKELVPVGEETAKGIEKGILEPKTSVNFDNAGFQKKVYDALGISEKTVDKINAIGFPYPVSPKEMADGMIDEKSHAAKKSDIQKTVEKLQECGFKEAGEAISKATNAMAEMTSSIKDSGSRREFSTGAVRDIQEGKGRCDLMPLDVIGHLLFDDPFIFQVHEFTKDGDPEHLCCALEVASRGNGYPWDRVADMLLDASLHFEAGAKKYGEYNWQRGIPTKCYIDSAVRHYLKMCRGDTDEPHDRAFVWNILCCIWTCRHKPELNDYPRKEKSNE